MARGEKDGHQLSLEHRRVGRERERASIIFVRALINDLSSASTIMQTGTIGEDVQLAELTKPGGTREAIANNLIPLWRIDGMGVVGTIGSPHSFQILRPAEAMRSIVAFGVCAAPPVQVGRIRVAESSIEGAAPQEEGKGQLVKYDGQTAGKARPGRVSKSTQGKSVESIKASGSLLEGDIMCPDHGGIRNGGTYNGSINPFGDVRTGPPG